LIAKGVIVTVSLRKKFVLGIIIKEVKKPLGNFKVKEIHKEYRNKKLGNNLRNFLNWVSYYNYINLGSALKLFLPNQNIIEETYNIVLYAKKESSKDLSLRQKKILDYLSKKPKTKKEFILKFNNKAAELRTLMKRKLIFERNQLEEIKNPIDLSLLNLKKLTLNQERAYIDIKKRIYHKEKKPIFLDGVTGSGKTEIYFKLIKEFLEKKKQVLVLLPEIALSEQWLERFKSCFGFYPLVWNSKVKISQKRKVWNAVMRQKTLIVVGARSSLFLPFLNIGLVVIDEENDQSYKQEDGVIYNARDMAILKSKIEKTSILLVSATPSLETFKNCKEEKYHWVKIKSRFKDTAKPKIQVVDMKNSTKSLISKEFEIQIKDNLNNKKQSLILINRRGYAPVTLCIKCGKKRKCKYCDSSLVYHKEIDLLMCHQCGKKEVYESICNSCNNGKFIFVGTGLERVYEEVIRLFPKAKIIKLSSDYMNKEIFFKTLKKIENSKIDIIVGTQIISKGFDFGNLKSVFIVDFDIWFNNADIRTNEKVFQLTQQVAGRAGRRDEEGEVFIQTFDPNNKLLDYIAKNERDLFYYKELKIRSKNLLPPYAKLLSVTISSKDLNLAEIKAKNIRSLFLASKDLQVYGPIPAQIYYIKNNYRLKLLVKARNSLIIQKYLLEKNFSSHINAKVKIKFDVDPYNLY
tara:strand:+ start:609 stop:2675 length:2067 start_codon:yes stop_codon:yes gene_type:complete